jgi:hypothetical protein
VKQCPCKPILYLDGTTIRVLKINFCAEHARLDELKAALKEALLMIEALSQGARPNRSTL